jgi:hypothetical protein
VQLHQAQRLLEEQRICVRLQQSYEKAAHDLALEQYRIPQQLADAIATATHHTPTEAR